MAGKIFINYRRGDDPGYTQALFGQFTHAFRPEQLFMDVDNIAPGLNFIKVLGDQVAKCDALVAVVGKGWLDAADQQGRRRLDNPDDFVRIEIEQGLAQKKRVIPVLVNDARMPRPEDLPDAMREFALCNAVRLTHERFRADSQGLIKALGDILKEGEEARRAKAEAAARAKDEAERRAQEAATLRKAEEQANAQEAVRREKEEARLAAIAGLSPEHIAKAEELANWEFIKDSGLAQDFRDHLARFPSGVVERMARAKLEALVWAGIGTSPSLDALFGFLAEFPAGVHAAEANARRGRLEAEVEAAKLTQERDLQKEQKRRQEIEAWAEASAENTVEAYTGFLERWSEGPHEGAARAALRKLQAPSNATGAFGYLSLSAFGLGLLVLLFLFIQNKNPERQAVTVADDQAQKRLVDEAAAREAYYDKINKEQLSGDAKGKQQVALAKEPMATSATPRRPGWLGVKPQDITPEELTSLGAGSGVLVTEVIEGSPAAHAGLQARDVVFEIDGVRVRNALHLFSLVARLRESTASVVKIWRGAASSSVNVVSGGRAPLPQDLGVILAESSDGGASAGVEIDAVAAASAAGLKGLKPSDVIVSIRDRAVTKLEDVNAELLAAQQTGRSAVDLQVRTADGVHFIGLKLYEEVEWSDDDLRQSLYSGLEVCTQLEHLKRTQCELETAGKLANGKQSQQSRARAAYKALADQNNAEASYMLAKLYDKGTGGGRDGEVAAKYLLLAAALKNEPARKALEGNLHSSIWEDVEGWSTETIRALQRLLKSTGHYDGPDDGDWGSGSQRAAAAYLKSK